MDIALELFCIACNMEQCRQSGDTPLTKLAALLLLREAASSSEEAMSYCLHTPGSTHLHAPPQTQVDAT